MNRRDEDYVEYFIRQLEYIEDYACEDCFDVGCDRECEWDDVDAYYSYCWVDEIHDFVYTEEDSDE